MIGIHSSIFKLQLPEKLLGISLLIKGKVSSNTFCILLKKSFIFFLL
jgi:hypothetical protein